MLTKLIDALFGAPPPPSPRLEDDLEWRILRDRYDRARAMHIASEPHRRALAQRTHQLLRGGQ